MGRPRCLEVVLSFVVLVSFASQLGAPAQAKLVAYYNFDDTTFSGVSGYTDHTVPNGAPASLASISDTEGRFNKSLAVLTKGALVGLSGLDMFPGLATTQWSVAVWVKFDMSAPVQTERIIFQKSDALRLQLVARDNDPLRYRLLCKIVFGTSQSATATSGYNFYNESTVYWNHVACTFNSTHVCLASNGTVVDCAKAPASQILPTASVLYVSLGGSPSRGVMGWVDELKFYDHGLSIEELQLLSGALAANDLPSASIGNAGELSFSAPSIIQLNGIGSDLRQAFSGSPYPAGNSSAGLTYEWSILSSSCLIADIADATTQRLRLALNNLGSFQLTLCVSDGELASCTSQPAKVVPSQPVINFQSVGPRVQVPSGSLNFPITVVASSLPLPDYQWQYMVLELVNSTTTNDTLDALVTRSINSRHYDIDDVDDDLYGGLVARDGNATLQPVWYNIEGATNNSLLLNGTEEFNNMTYRCVISNTVSYITTDEFVVTIVAALPTTSAGPDPDSSGVNTGAIIGGVVGGVSGVCLCLLLLLALILVIALKRKGRQQKKLRQPDYEELAYADVSEVTMTKKMQEYYSQLERLMFVDDGRLASAIFEIASISDVDKVAKALMRVYEFQHRGHELLERRITKEVAVASDEGTLFRANSLAAKLFATYVRMTALPYLFFTLVTSVHSINDNAVDSFGDSDGNSSSSKRARYLVEADEEDLQNGHMAMDVFRVSSMEIDPHKMGDAADATINSLELWLVAQKLYKCIVSGENLMPTQIKELMRHIDAEVSAKFGPSSQQAQFRAIGGFLFLRMVCPALMAPQVFGLLDGPPHPVAQRQLILVSKVLQNLANDTLPGTKEAYMEQLNNFIITNKPSLERFYADILAHADKGKPAESEVPQKARLEGLAVLHQFVATHLAQLEQLLMREESSQDLIEELKSVLAELHEDSV